eukprot:gene13041-27524_t
MKGLWLENQQLTLRLDIPIPSPPENEALVRIISAGICNTDLELIKGYYPYAGVLGHEFVGIVEHGPAHLMKKRVVGDINATCGNCRFCDTNNFHHCENRTVLGIVHRNGAFSDYITLPSKNLHVVPDNVSTELATLTEPIAAALEIQQQISIMPKDRVLVVGDGKLGLLVALTLSLTACDLLVIGRHREKLDILVAQGIRTGFEDSVTDKEFDICVECTGNPGGFVIARRAVRPQGTIVMKSTYAAPLTIDISSIVVDEIRLIGSRCGPFDLALKVLAEGSRDFTPLIQAKFPLSEGLEAFEKAKTRGMLKTECSLKVSVEVFIGRAAPAFYFYWTLDI